jgi:hypothetical protein
MEQLRAIVKAARVTPQSRQRWFRELEIVLAEHAAEPEASRRNTLAGNACNERPKNLILDVKTRWSSTHQMLG